MKDHRITIVFIIIAIFSATIIGRLAFLQITKHDFYMALAMGQQRLSQSISPERGEIFIRDKTDSPFILATNKNSKYVFASPNKIKNKEETIGKLSEVLDLEKEDVLKGFKEDSLFVVIKKKLTSEEVEKIEELDLLGVYIDEEPLRFYPEENLASHLLGFVGGEGYGQYGLEAFYEKELKGIEGVEEGERSLKGNIVFFDPEKSLPAQEGADLILGIDYYIQFQAEKLLKEVKERLDIEDGQIIVIDPITGKILTMASLEDFNPNKYSEHDLEVFINPVSQEIFEPGSIFKPLTMAVGIEDGKITPQTSYIDKGYVKIGPDTIYNYDERVYGKTTMTEVLEKSINTGAVFVQDQISHSVFLDYLDRFGIFEKTGIDLQSEVFSRNEEFKKGWEVNFATCAFGQGIELTPIQMVRAFSVFANRGKLMKPFLVEEIRKANGEVLVTEPEIQREVVSEKTASQITAMLVSVIENGFGKRAKIPGYYIAGKTGTSQVSWSALGVKQSGYSDKTIQTFIGFAPAFNPKFLIMVKLDNPKTRTAEYSAVPVFHDLAKYIIDYYHIPPDYEE